ncbi:MAG: DUF1223 domain-containing protein [Acidobacteria bacterium]|nr:DUF1223 domain-containing protein [Acidobacteriota bacterium]MCZ6726961.1 DUF1223 domain-containing protein [Acidobacteriota bacterium]
MKRRHSWLSSALTAALLAGAAASSAAAEGAADRKVVVELFTSQGCSSCPSADRLLSELGSDGWRGIQVIPLSFHVDYWNYIGWTDPFSAAAWSERQRRYATSFSSDRVYTPQLIVDGQSECVGAYRREVGRHIENAARRAAEGEIELRLDGGAAGSTLVVSAALLPAAPTGANLLAAVFETGLETAVGRGENARRTLRNDHVVRRLISLAQLTPGQRLRIEHRLELDPGWRREHLGVAVFLQSPETLEIYGAEAVDF